MSTQKGSDMRLMVPTDVKSVDILDGPGTTEMLDTWIEKNRLYAERMALPQRIRNRIPYGPSLRFTVAHPETGAPTTVSVEMTSDLEKEDHGAYYDAYCFTGYIDRKPVRVQYLLNKNKRSRRGIISDIELSQ